MAEAKKLSPAYRNDDVASLPESVRDYLDTHYFARLPNIQETNPKLLVVFSGGSSLGKSTLSKMIQQELGAIVLENDAIKEHLLAFDPSLYRDDLNRLTWQYSMDLYARLDTLTPNGLVVRDGVIDWYFDRILPVFTERGYAVFTIAFDVSNDLRVRLIKQRGDKPTITVDRLISLMPEQDLHMERFRRAHTPDIILNDTNLFDAERVVLAVKQALQTVKMRVSHKKI